MIDPSFAVDTDLPPTPPTELVLIQMSNLERALDEKREENQRLLNTNTMYRESISNFEQRIESVKLYIMEQIAESDFDEDAAHEIANILDFELEKEVSFEAEVRFYGTMKVGPNDDAAELINNLNFYVEGGYYSDLDFAVDDVIVDQVDITE